MTILERLKLELNNQKYFTDDEYKQLLQEENLNSTDTFNKDTHYRKLLETVLNILNMVANDIDIMRKISDGSTEFSVSQAYKNLEERIRRVQLKINSLPTDEEETDNIIKPFII